MKTWMKILMWFGLGGGIGFFAGYQVGARVQKTEDEESQESDMNITAFKPVAQDALEVYRGGDTDGDKFLINPWIGTATDEDDEMPEEEPRIGDEEDIEDIPQLHPQDLVPSIITEQEYYQNEWNYDQESLVYYGRDNVLFDIDTQSVISDPTQVIGLATLMGLNAVHETLFVRNETTSTLFRIDWTEDAFDMRNAGDILPDEENDDFTEEDLD